MRLVFSFYLLAGLVLGSCQRKQNETALPAMDTTTLSPTEGGSTKEPTMSTTEIDFSAGNFAILSRVNGERPEWSRGSINGSSGGGEGVFFFENNGDFYGSIFGFDYDSYWVSGTYKLVEKSDTVVRFSLSGTSTVNIEGNGVTQKNQLSDSELRLTFKVSERQSVESELFVSIFQGYSAIFFEHEVGNPLAVFQPLSANDLMKAKENFLKAFQAIEQPEKESLNSQDSIKQ